MKCNNLAVNIDLLLQTLPDNAQEIICGGDGGDILDSDTETTEVSTTIPRAGYLKIKKLNS